jgi:predicted TIM-barrel fold metal-dependent hydrolase
VRSLPNLDFEISRFVPGGGITSVVDAIGPERVLFGSRFPDSAISPQLFSLHRNGLSEDALRAICAGNAERLMGIG